MHTLIGSPFERGVSSIYRGTQHGQRTYGFLSSTRTRSYSKNKQQVLRVPLSLAHVLGWVVLALARLLQQPAAIECGGAAAGAPLADSKGQTNQLYNFALRPNLAAGHLAAQLLAKVIDLSFKLDLPRAHLFAAACIAHICANHAVNHGQPPLVLCSRPLDRLQKRQMPIDRWGSAPRRADRRNAKPPPHTSANRFPFNYANCTSLETN